MYRVRKHVEEKEDTWVIEWPEMTDDDGVPLVGLVWNNGNCCPLVFPEEDAALKVCGWLNKGYADED